MEYNYEPIIVRDENQDLVARCVMITLDCL